MVVDRIGHPSLKQSHSSGHPKSHQKLMCQEVFFSCWMKTNKRTHLWISHQKIRGNVSNPLFLPTWCVLKKKHKRIPHGFFLAILEAAKDFAHAGRLGASFGPQWRHCQPGTSGVWKFGLTRNGCYKVVPQFGIAKLVNISPITMAMVYRCL